ncbi:WxL domain-containing protein [Lactiplantibacillus daoliensis]|uniref:WxL domain-containing protein n=1 Tax=Lactiplantibacillus daoliensis TaxID=2559916 RepID=A0ABW1UFY2_9LACO|nr:WxL domain-containing protein [Lactiplantibacillus daoliensis]
MFKMKKMSLVALGAATLFMAPAVVHAAEPTELDTPATVNIEGEVGSIYLKSAPELEFGTVDNVSETNTFTVPNKGKGKHLTVLNTKDIEGWTVNVSMTPFMGNNIQWKGAQLDFKTNDVSSDRTDDQATVQTNPASIMAEDGEKTLLLSSSESGKMAAKGETHLYFNDNAVDLTGRGGYPAGEYAARVYWDLEHGEVAD